MTDLRDQLQSTLGTAYVFERELGGGGMSRVFVAEETALGHKVVVKVLHPDLVAGVNVDRFRREIQLAARLQQAQIVPLLAAGEIDGIPYYSMPFVEEETAPLASFFWSAYVGGMDQENPPLPLAEFAAGRPIVTTLRLKISRSVAEALQFDSIKRRARGAMVTDVRFDFDEKRPGEIRIACSMPMAIFLVGELRSLDERAKARRDPILAFDTARAVAATFKAIEDGDRAAAAAAIQQRNETPRAENHT